MSNEIDGVNMDELAGLIEATPPAAQPAPQVAPRTAPRQVAAAPQAAPAEAPLAEEAPVDEPVYEEAEQQDVPPPPPPPPRAQAPRPAQRPAAPRKPEPRSVQEVIAARATKLPQRGTRPMPGFEQAQVYDPSMDEDDEEWEIEDPRRRSNGQRTQQRPQRRRMNEDDDDDDGHSPRIVEVSAADIKRRNAQLAAEAARIEAAKFDEQQRRVNEAIEHAKAIQEGRIPAPVPVARPQQTAPRPPQARPAVAMAPASRPATPRPPAPPQAAAKPAPKAPVVTRAAAPARPLVESGGRPVGRLPKFMLKLAGIGLRLTLAALEVVSDEAGVSAIIEKTSGLLGELHPNTGKLRWDGDKQSPPTNQTDSPDDGDSEADQS